ncbi:hypothetical protein AB832_07630 [Flavobacteriaceae bacterium (ex Bugula neritina AB1)]|nr:hypothetical protein AB832_07630 [Flavobacteriaceae bacterium (ex Bugula neritina AB1)]
MEDILLHQAINCFFNMLDKTIIDKANKVYGEDTLSFAKNYKSQWLSVDLNIKDRSLFDTANNSTVVIITVLTIVCRQIEDYNQKTLGYFLQERLTNYHQEQVISFANKQQ